jgi:hypothetical protein
LRGNDEEGLVDCGDDEPEFCGKQRIFDRVIDETIAGIEALRSAFKGPGAASAKS